MINVETKKTKNKRSWVSVGMGLMLAAGCGTSPGPAESTERGGQDSGGEESAGPKPPAEAGVEGGKEVTLKVELKGDGKGEVQLQVGGQTKQKCTPGGAECSVKVEPGTEVSVAVKEEAWSFHAELESTCKAKVTVQGDETCEVALLRKDKYALVATRDNTVVFKLDENGALTSPSSPIKSVSILKNITVTEDGQYVLILTTSGLESKRLELDADRELVLKDLTSVETGTSFTADESNSVITQTRPSGTFVYATTKDKGVLAFKIKPGATDELEFVGSESSIKDPTGLLLVNNTLYVADSDASQVFALRMKEDGSFDKPLPTPAVTSAEAPKRLATLGDKKQVCATSSTAALSCFQVQSDGSLTSRQDVVLEKDQGWGIVSTLDGRFAYVSHENGFLTRLKLNDKGFPELINPTEQLKEESSISTTKSLQGLALGRDGRMLYATDTFWGSSSKSYILWAQPLYQANSDLALLKKAHNRYLKHRAFALALTPGPVK